MVVVPTMSPEEIVKALYGAYSMDAAHEAIAVYLALSQPPRDPIGWCRRVAQRAEVNEYRYHSTREGRPRLIHATGTGVNPSTSTGDGDDFDPGAVEARLFGVQEPEQLRRLEAREVLEGLHSVDLARGMGAFDPEPQDPPEGFSEESQTRDRWRWARYNKTRRKA